MPRAKSSIVAPDRHTIRLIQQVPAGTPHAFGPDAIYGRYWKVQPRAGPKQGLNGSGGFVSIENDPLLNDASEFTVIIPPVGSDGVDNRLRLYYFNDTPDPQNPGQTTPYMPGDEWLEIYRGTNELVAVGTPMSENSVPESITMLCRDLFAILKKTRETACGYWCHSARDAFEHYSRLWLPTAAISNWTDQQTNFPVYSQGAINLSADGRWYYEGVQAATGPLTLTADTGSNGMLLSTVQIPDAGPLDHSCWRIETSITTLIAPGGSVITVTFGMTNGYGGLPVVQLALVPYGPTAFLGPLRWGSTANNAAVGTVAWQNSPTIMPGYAEAVLPAGATSQYLNATGFGFAIPTAATIAGIVATVQRGSDQTTVATDSSVKLLSGGAVTGTEHASLTGWTDTPPAVSLSQTRAPTVATGGADHGHPWTAVSGGVLPPAGGYDISTGTTTVQSQTRNANFSTDGGDRGQPWTHNAGGIISWATGGYDSANAIAGGYTNTLYLTNFGFSIPANAVITGIAASIPVAQAAPPPATNTYGAFTAYVNFCTSIGVVIPGTSPGGGGPPWPYYTGMTPTQYGGASNNWGDTGLTPALVNSIGFGLGIAPYINTLNTQPFIGGGSTNYPVQMTVYYYIPSYTDTLYFTGFGFNLPANATVTGIAFSLDRQAANTVNQYTAQLCSATGTLIGTNQSGGAQWPSSWTQATWGGVGNTCGAALTPAIVNAAGFGFAMAAFLASLNAVAYIGIPVSVTVYYTIPGTTTVTYGSLIDLWGAALTPAICNAAGFGIAISAHNPGASACTATITSVTIAVYYSVPGGQSLIPPVTCATMAWGGGTMVAWTPSTIASLSPPYTIAIEARERYIYFFIGGQLIAIAERPFPNGATSSQAAAQLTPFLQLQAGAQGTGTPVLITPPVITDAAPLPPGPVSPPVIT